MLLSGATSISGANFSYFRLSDNDDLYHCNALSSSRPAEKKRCILYYDLKTIECWTRVNIYLRSDDILKKINNMGVQPILSQLSTL